MKTFVKYRTTSEKIKSLFIELLKEKRIDQIRISEICERLQINRSTFYRHYEDIYALLKSLEDEFEKGLKAVYKKIEENSDVSIKVMEEILAFIKDNREICDILFVYQKDNALWLIFDELSVDLFMKKIYEKYAESHNCNQKELRESVKFVCGGFYSLYRDWLVNDCKEDIKVLAKRLAVLSDVCIEKVLAGK